MTSFVHLESQISVIYFSEVTNGAEIAELMASSGSDRSWTAAAATMIYSSQHVRAAALRALINEQDKRLKTKQSWHSELLYYLAGTTKISDAMTQFGVNSSTTQMAVVLLNADEDLQKTVRQLVKGSELSENEFNSHSSSKKEALIRMFKLTHSEVNLGDIDMTIITKIATKDI